MDLKELAEIMNNCEYRKERDVLTEEVLKELGELGIVVLFGASDDLMEFRGAIYDEVGCYDGGRAYLTKDGLLVNECDNDECPFFEELKGNANQIDAIWDEEGYSWIYKTNIPHETFDVIETYDDETTKYCRGIIFYLKDV